MKTISISTILNIYTRQGLYDVFEFLNRIEYKPIDSFAIEIIHFKRDINQLETKLNKLLKDASN